MCKIKSSRCIVCTDDWSMTIPCKDWPSLRYGAKTPDEHADITEYVFSFHHKCAEKEGFANKSLSWINENYNGAILIHIGVHMTDDDDMTDPYILKDNAGNMIHAPGPPDDGVVIWNPTTPSITV